MSAASGTKFGRFLVQNSAGLLPKHRPLLALNSAACLYKKRPPSGTKFGCFIAQTSAASGTKFGCLVVQKAAALLYKIRPLYCTKIGHFLALHSAVVCALTRPHFVH